MCFKLVPDAFKYLNLGNPQ